MMSCIIYLGRRSIPVIYLWLLLVGQVATAEQIMLVTPPRDIALKEPESPPPPGGPFTYATTGDKPNWYIQAWNIPAGKLSTFVERKERSNTVFSSSAPEAGVQIVKLPDGRTSYRLSQDGTVLPCSHQGEPLESNLLAGPNALHARPPEWSSMTLRRDDLLPIAQLVHLVASATVAVRFAPTVLRKECAVSRLPSFSHHPESIGKHGEFGEHGSEPLDQRQQPRLRHIGDQIVEHAALPEQRVSAPLGSV